MTSLIAVTISLKHQASRGSLLASHPLLYLASDNVNSRAMYSTAYLFSITMTYKDIGATSTVDIMLCYLRQAASVSVVAFVLNVPW